MHTNVIKYAMGRKPISVILHSQLVVVYAKFMTRCKSICIKYVTTELKWNVVENVLPLGTFSPGNANSGRFRSNNYNLCYNSRVFSTNRPLKVDEESKKILIKRRKELLGKLYDSSHGKWNSGNQIKQTQLFFSQLMMEDGRAQVDASSVVVEIIFCTLLLACVTIFFVTLCAWWVNPASEVINIPNLKIQYLFVQGRQRGSYTPYILIYGSAPNKWRKVYVHSAVGVCS